jgi:hypothetical protein
MSFFFGKKVVTVGLPFLGNRQYCVLASLFYLLHTGCSTSSNTITRPKKAKKIVLEANETGKIVAGTSRAEKIIAGMGNTKKKMTASRKFSVDFSSSKLNKRFRTDKLLGKTIILLPTRSGMGGSASDEKVTKSLDGTLIRALYEYKIITDNEMDKHFTDIGRWDEYLSYIENYSQKGIVRKDDLEAIIKLYAEYNPDYIVTITCDPFVLGVEGVYPTVFNLYIDFQVWDLKSKRKVWGGTCNGETTIRSKSEKSSTYQELADRLAQRIASELTKRSPR